MKKNYPFLFIFIFLLITNISPRAQVGIGTTTPAASAQLDVNSTTKGLLPPRMTTVQRDLISIPAAGLFIFNLTTNSLQIYNGTGWVSLTTPSNTAVFLPTIVIGTQQWMNNNLDVAFYRNGDPIPQVTDPTHGLVYNRGLGNNKSTLGKSMENYTIGCSKDPRGLAPQGWHIPSDAEWTALEALLGGSLVAAGKMKEAGTLNWTAPNTAGNNNSGWAGLPGGFRFNSGPFNNVSNYGFWWSSTESSATNAWSRYLSYSFGNFYTVNYSKPFGFSVRCVRDSI